MINRLKSLLSREPTAAHVASFDDRPLALAVLMVEAAHVDGAFDDAERAKVDELVRRCFKLNEVEIAGLIDTAESLHREAVDFVRFTRVVKDAFAPEERVEVIEMLWEVVYADSRIDDFEANLMRRLGGLLYVSDRDRGAARKRVAARLARDGLVN